MRPVLRSPVRGSGFCSIVEDLHYSCSGLAKWVSIIPVPWLYLCDVTQLRPKAPIQDGGTKATGDIPNRRRINVTGANLNFQIVASGI